MSAIIFHQNYDNPDQWAVNGLWAGALFTITANVSIVVTRQVPMWSAIIIFAAASYGTYLLLYFITFITTWFGFVTGIVTGGIGALSVFYLINRFLTPIQFKTKEIFI